MIIEVLCDYQFLLKIPFLTNLLNFQNSKIYEIHEIKTHQATIHSFSIDYVPFFRRIKV